MRSIIVLLMFIISMNTCIGAEIHISDAIVDSYDLLEGNTYILDNDVSAVGTAFEVKGDNVIFEGRGYNILYADTVTGYAIYNNGYDGLLISNVTVYNTNTGISNAYGIYLYNTMNNTVQNSILNSYKSHGLYLRACELSNINNCSIYSNTSGTALYMYQTYNSSIYDNIISSDTGYGVIFDYGKYNIFQNNNVSSNTNIAVSLPATSSNNTLISNDIISVSNVGLRLLDSHGHTIRDNYINGQNIALYLARTSTGCNNNTIANNIIIADSTSYAANAALYIYDGYNNVVQNNDIFSDAVYGAYFRQTYQNNIIGNYFRSSNYLGCLIGYGSYNNTVTNNVFEHTGENALDGYRKGIFVYDSENNVFSNNIVIGTHSKYPSNAVTHILIMGDSIAEGSGHTSIEYGGYQNHLNDLGTQYNAYFSNMAFSGERTNYGLERFAQTMDIFKPDIVLIAYGTNDLLDDRNETDIIMEIMTMCEIAEQKGSKPYVIANTPIYTNNEKRISLNMNLSVSCVANEYEFINIYDAIDSIPLNDNYDLYVSANYPDGIHPNNASNVLIAEYIYTYLEDDLQNNYNNYEDSVFTAYWLGILFLVVLAVYVSKTNSMFDEFNLNEPSTIIKVLTAILMIVISIGVLGDWF